MFGGRPFILYAYQNAMNYDIVDEKPTYLELDLYLDEVHDGDDIENGLAFNETGAYSESVSEQELSDNLNKLMGGV